jgi:hypothetical protein
VEKTILFLMSTKTLMTVPQFLELPDEELRRYELWQGELIEVGETVSITTGFARCCSFASGSF